MKPAPPVTRSNMTIEPPVALGQLDFQSIPTRGIPFQLTAERATARRHGRGARFLLKGRHRSSDARPNDASRASPPHGRSPFFAATPPTARRWICRRPGDRRLTCGMGTPIFAANLLKSWTILVDNRSATARGRNAFSRVLYRIKIQFATTACGRAWRVAIFACSFPASGPGARPSMPGPAAGMFARAGPTRLVPNQRRSCGRRCPDLAVRTWLRAWPASASCSQLGEMVSLENGRTARCGAATRPNMIECTTDAIPRLVATHDR